ncbi:hypothetical protein O6H91_07G122500 [Diphasiastrum complanatum]|uniref:Uncharacterized protein n=2 Tax=Diphasiastrum complanatum TaxID=34168 RepID=A0ACC2D9Q7_DIPCM|nr:hypothetical protein O6H91_07G122500 [Diphasiastrum complanatum]
MASSSSSSSCRVLASQAFRQSRLHFYYFSSVAGFTATSFRPRFLLASSLFSESFRCRHGVSSVSSDPGPLPFPGTYYSKPSAVHEKAGVYARPIASGFGKYSRRGISTEVRPDEGASSGESASSEGTPYDGSTSHDAQEQPSQENSKSAEGPYEEKLDEKKQVLRAALAHVPKLGWTEAAMLAGARDTGLSPSIVGAFPRKEAELVEYFMDDSMEKLTEEAENHKEELSNMILTARIAWLVRSRLQMQIPYISKWAQALSIQANPLNLPTTLKQRALLMDEIWHAAGDRSSDMDWITKRAILGGVYTATELYMLTDYSPEYQETWSFLDRRIKDAIDCRKTAQEASHLAVAIGAGLGNTINSFLRRQSPSGI